MPVRGVDLQQVRYRLGALQGSFLASAQGNPQSYMRVLDMLSLNSYIILIEQEAAVGTSQWATGLRTTLAAAAVTAAAMVTVGAAVEMHSG